MLTTAVFLAASAFAQNSAVGPEAWLLRLPDVGNGYLVGDDTGCGGLGTENAPPSVAEIAVTYRPALCAIQFERLWLDRNGAAGGARLVEGVVLVFGTNDGAAAAMRAGTDLAGYVLYDSAGVSPSSDPTVLGEETKVLAGSRRFTVLWRRGSVVALLHVHGESDTAARQTALALAHVQDERITNPTSLGAGVNDDREVALDDPKLGVPAYWLGRVFSPGGLPRLTLRDAFENREPEDGHAMAATIEYAGRHGSVTLDLWKPRRWARFPNSELGRDASWNSPCAVKRIVRLRHGHAQLYSGYAPHPRPLPKLRPGTAGIVAVSCPKRARDDFVAQVYLPHVVIAVNMANCVGCDTKASRYESFRALKAVARGLTRRR
jgi:hypothetical protein